MRCGTTGRHGRRVRAPCRVLLRMQQLLLDLAPVPAPTLDNFAPGATAAAARAAAVAGRHVGSCVVSVGTARLGQDAPAERCGRRAGVSRRGCPVVRRWAGRAAATGPSRAAAAAIDDVQRTVAAGQAALFTLLNRAAQGELRLLMAGANAPAGLTLRDDVRTRLGAGLVLQLSRSTTQTRSKLCRPRTQPRLRAAARGRRLPVWAMAGATCAGCSLYSTRSIATRCRPAGPSRCRCCARCCSGAD